MSICIFIEQESVELALKTYIHLIYEQMNSDSDIVNRSAGIYGRI